VVTIKQFQIQHYSIHNDSSSQTESTNHTKSTDIALTVLQVKYAYILLPHAKGCT